MEKVMILSSFLFFSTLHKMNMRFEKVEFLVGGQKKEQRRGRSEPSKRRSWWRTQGAQRNEDKK